MEILEIYWNYFFLLKILEIYWKFTKSPGIFSGLVCEFACLSLIFVIILVFEIVSVQNVSLDPEVAAISRRSFSKL